MIAAAAVLLGVLAQSGAVPTLAPSYVPQRVYDTNQHAFSDFESMLGDLARADIIFVGEQHDDPNTHRLELAILEGLHRRNVPVAVSLEMFERDTQGALDQFLTGSTSEDVFLKGARPWPRYATDYRPLVDFAKANGWPVIAANVPRRHATDVAKRGLEAVDQLSLSERPHAAREFECPRDVYFDKFAAAMAEHPAPGTEKMTVDEQRTRTGRYYESQCVKDETMAESIAAVTGRQVVHFNGAFHSDFGLGTAERTRRRLPRRRLVVVSILPVADLNALAPSGDDLKRADYLVYTIK
ncbi:MAG: ChaN family lipoprotein [Vicinamibacterales bacterium]